jgi:hypothetical protein
MLASLPDNLLYSIVLPAILLSAAAAFLARAREIDLSLDQQCYFVASVQAALYLLLPSWIGAAVGLIVSFALLVAIQSARLYFNRVIGLNGVATSDGLVTSIASGMILVGAASVITWAAGGQRTPSYTLELPPVMVLAVCGGILVAIWGLDCFSGNAQRVTFPVSPAVGAPPSKRASVIYAVAPAALLTAGAATLLGAYSQSVTPAFTSGLGIIAATLAILTFGRVRRSFVAGIGLAVIFIVPQMVFPGGGLVQSYVEPVSRLLIIAILPIFLSRP